jgi:acyl dehydratase
MNNAIPQPTRERASVGREITDEAVAALRAKLGQVIGSSHTPYLTETSLDASRHWADGIGDRNTLWTDPARGEASPWGRPLCAPTILYAFNQLAIGYRGGLPGVHSMFGGSDWRWRRPIGWGERIHATVRFVDLIERQSKFAGRSFQQISEITFETDQKEVVAVARSWGFRVERKRAEELGKYKTVEVQSYDAAALARITECYRAETIRGQTPLYVEDVQVGESVPEIIRGPYTVTTAVAFEQGWGGLFIKAHGAAMDYYARHPAAGILNSFGVPEPPEAVHWDSDLARRVGVPAAYDYGPERISWLGSMLTNWIGDAGFLERLHVQVRRHNIIGDLTTCTGRITGVSLEERAIDLDILATNQRGDITATGEARVILPSRMAPLR